MNTHQLVIIITGFLIILWGYTTLSKLFNFRKFRHALITQVFPQWVGKILLYLLPLIEIIVALLLYKSETRLLGMYVSSFVMMIFTIYAGGAAYGFYDEYPCACGGIFGRLGWRKHFKVNIILTLIALCGVVLMEI